MVAPNSNGNESSKRKRTRKVQFENEASTQASAATNNANEAMLTRTKKGSKKKNHQQRRANEFQALHEELDIVQTYRNENGRFQRKIPRRVKAARTRKRRLLDEEDRERTYERILDPSHRRYRGPKITIEEEFIQGSQVLFYDDNHGKTDNDATAKDKINDKLDEEDYEDENDDDKEEEEEDEEDEEETVDNVDFVDDGGGDDFKNSNKNDFRFNDRHSDNLMQLDEEQDEEDDEEVADDDDDDEEGNELLLEEEEEIEDGEEAEYEEEEDEEEEEEEEEEEDDDDDEENGAAGKEVEDNNQRVGSKYNDNNDSSQQQQQEGEGALKRKRLTDEELWPTRQGRRKRKRGGKKQKPLSQKERRRAYRMRNFKSFRMAQRHGDALGAYARGMSQEAIQKLSAVAKDAPSAPQVYSSLGMVYDDMLRQSQESKKYQEEGDDGSNNNNNNNNGNISSASAKKAAAQLAETMTTKATATAATDAATAATTTTATTSGTDTTTTEQQKQELEERRRQQKQFFAHDPGLAEQLKFGQKAYGSYQAAAVLCKKDYRLWVKSADSALAIADIHNQALFRRPQNFCKVGAEGSNNANSTTKIVALSGEEQLQKEKYSKYHLMEKQRWILEAKHDLTIADNLKPIGIDIPGRLASCHIELGKLSDALTILTDLKNGKETSEEFSQSYKIWYLYSYLMLKIGYECIQWNKGQTTKNENYIFRRWLRKWSKNFDWKERRLQALSLSLQAAAGSKSCSKYLDWTRERAKKLNEAKKKHEEMIKKKIQQKKKLEIDAKKSDDDDKSRWHVDTTSTGPQQPATTKATHTTDASDIQAAAKQKLKEMQQKEDEEAKEKGNEDDKVEIEDGGEDDEEGGKTATLTPEQIKEIAKAKLKELQREEVEEEQEDNEKRESKEEKEEKEQQISSTNAATARTESSNFHLKNPSDCTSPLLTLANAATTGEKMPLQSTTALTNEEINDETMDNNDNDNNKSDDGDKLDDNQHDDNNNNNSDINVNYSNDDSNEEDNQPFDEEKHILSEQNKVELEAFDQTTNEMALEPNSTAAKRRQATRNELVESHRAALANHSRDFDDEKDQQVAEDDNNLNLSSSLYVSSSTTTSSSATPGAATAGSVTAMTGNDVDNIDGVADGDNGNLAAGDQLQQQKQQQKQQEGQEGRQRQQREFPISASAPTVCDIASELMKLLLGFELYDGCKLVGEAVSSYMKERAKLRDERAELLQKSQQRQKKIINSKARDPFSLQAETDDETSDEDDSDSSDDEDKDNSYLSDDDRLDEDEQKGEGLILKSLRQGTLPPELNILYALSLIKDGGRTFLASKCFNALDLLELESASWLREDALSDASAATNSDLVAAAAAAAANEDVSWFLFKSAMTEPLKRNSGYAFVTDVLRKTGKEREWSHYFAPMLERHMNTLQEGGLLDEVQRLKESHGGVINRTRTPYTDFRKNQIIKVVIASARYRICHAESLFNDIDTAASADTGACKSSALGKINSLASSAVTQLISFFTTIWKVGIDGSISPRCSEILSLFARAFSLLSNEIVLKEYLREDDKSSVAYLTELTKNCETVITLLCNSEFVIGINVDSDDEDGGKKDDGSGCGAADDDNDNNDDEGRRRKQNANREQKGKMQQEEDGEEDEEQRKSGTDADTVSWTQFPFPASWQTSVQKAISFRSYNLCAATNVSLFSGWEREEFCLRLLRRKRGRRHFGLKLDDDSVAGLLSCGKETKLAEQWDRIRSLLPSGASVDLKRLLSEVKEKEWYKEAVEKREESLKREQSIGHFGEEDGLDIFLVYSKFCILLAEQQRKLDQNEESHKLASSSESENRQNIEMMVKEKQKNGQLHLLLTSLSVLLPVSQFCLDTRLWSSELGKAASDISSFDEWRQHTIEYPEDVDPKEAGSYVRIRKLKPALENSLDVWFSEENGHDALSNLVLIPTKELQKLWKSAEPQEQSSQVIAQGQAQSPVDEQEQNQDHAAVQADADIDDAKECMQKLHIALLQLRTCYTEVATEKVSLQVASALLDVARHEQCQNPFICLQQAAVFANQGPKGGSSDDMFKESLPETDEKCTPLNALMILGRADCLQCVGFPYEAEFLCSSVARICSLHRDKHRPDLDWNLRWKIIGILAYNLSVMIRFSVQKILEKDPRKLEYLPWDQSAVDELMRGRSDGKTWENSLEPGSKIKDITPSIVVDAEEEEEEEEYMEEAEEVREMGEVGDDESNAKDIAFDENAAQDEASSNCNDGVELVENDTVVNDDFAGSANDGVDGYANAPSQTSTIEEDSTTLNNGFVNHAHDYSVHNYPLQNFPLQTYPVQNYPLQNCPMQNYATQQYSMQNYEYDATTAPWTNTANSLSTENMEMPAQVVATFASVDDNFNIFKDHVGVSSANDYDEAVEMDVVEV